MAFVGKDEVMEKLTFEQVILRHLNTISIQLSLDSCIIASHFDVLEALLSPYLDEQFIKEWEAINGFFGKDKTFMLKKEASLRLRCFILLLDRLEMLLTSEKTSLI